MTGNEIKFIRSLQQKKFRDQTGLFTVEGEKMVAEAISSGWEVTDVYRRDDIGDDAMSRISSMSTPSPVLAVVRMKVCEETEAPLEGLALGLDSVRDPGNLGTILRIADWFGVSTIFASRDCAEMYNQKVINASMGSVFRVRLTYTDLPGICDRYRDRSLCVAGTFLAGDNIYEASLPGTALLIMGNEANGISPQVSSKVSSRLTIPTFSGGAESLNVAVATAICVSEFKRR